MHMYEAFLLLKVKAEVVSVCVMQSVTGSKRSSALTFQENKRKGEKDRGFIHLFPLTRIHFLISGLGRSYYCMNECI